MGLLDGILDYIRVNDDDEDYEYDDYEDVKSEPIVNNTKRAETAERHSSRRSRVQEDDEPQQEFSKRERTVSRPERNSKVVPMRSAARGLEVCIVKPTSFEDSQQVCEILLEGRACVVNLEGFDADDAQRIMDFISGCIFAINGKLHRISKYIFIFAPDNVDISGDYLDLLPNDKKNTMTINREF